MPMRMGWSVMFAPLDPRALTRRDGFAGIVERVASNGQERCDARRGWVRGGGRLHSARVSRSPTPAPELTVRAILTGMLLGALLTPCNVYSGLKIRSEEHTYELQ